jgi:hypothetical protein
MPKLKCTVCDHDIDLPDEAKDGERFSCPNCFAQLSLKIINGKKVARCAVCSREMLECSEDCERRLSEREKRGFFDIKL